MATPGGTDDLNVGRYAGVAAALRAKPNQFEFFQAVRLIERLLPARAPWDALSVPIKK